MLTFAGNPVLSTPNGKRLDAALAGLEFMVAIDIYINETTRHADVILPPGWTLADEHVDVFFPQMTIRNVVGWAPPVVRPDENDRPDWEIMLGLAERLGGGPTGMKPLDVAFGFAKRFGYRWSPMKTIDLLLRTGTYGDGFLPWSKGLSLEKLKQHPHGLDLGALEPGVIRRVLHRDRRVHIAPQIFLDAMTRLNGELARVAAGLSQAARTSRAPGAELLLIGRRDLRTNNSWMHNVPSLVSGKLRCVLHVHPDDAARAGLVDGKNAVLESRIYSGEVPIRVTDDMTPGVVSLPHGWGHAAAAPWQRVAADHAGVSINDWSDDAEVESLVGQSILNGVRVRLRAVEGTGVGDRTSTAA
jgi:anaerobic selenocysteine-containing dehydrogenase